MKRRLLSTTTATAAKPVAESGGIPWFTIIPLSLVGAAVAYFYRQNRNSKSDQALREKMRSELVMSPEEMVLVREKNAITPAMFTELCNRAKRHFTGNVDLHEFLDRFCMEQLGGDFQARGEFKARHVLERLEHKLKNEADVDLALCVLSLTVFSDPVLLCEALFKVFAEGGDEGEMTQQKFERIVDLLDDTEQLPVRVLVKETEQYPFNQYARISGAQVAQKAHPGPASLTKQEFVDLLMSTDVCVWGACWNHDMKNKKK